MDPGELLRARVASRLKATGKRPVTAAMAAGLGRDFITDILSGKKRSVRGDKLQQLAEALEVDADFLTGAMAAPRTVPLVGYVGAGAEAHFYASADEGLDQVDAPPGAGPDTRAAEIRGESLGPLFDRWLVFYDDVRSPITADLIGRLCVVGLPNGKILVKKVQRSRAAGLYHLLSNSEAPMLDQEVVWAARVRTMTPR